jgi:L-lactate dehydrogenase complex protein LldG
MDSRSRILETLRRDTVPAVALPEVAGPWQQFADRQAQFCEVLVSVGGQVVRVPELEQLPRQLAEAASFREAQRIWSLVPGMASSGGDWSTVTDPHALERLDYCVVPGEFGVAENGAVWVAQDALPHRAALFIAQHLVLVVPGDQIVQNMHEAYARIDPAGVSFGIFISGPSKTADIEQSLVIGAHGPRSLTVALLGAK